jgi:hypothetical protein
MRGTLVSIVLNPGVHKRAEEWVTELAKPPVEEGKLVALSRSRSPYLTGESYLWALNKREPQPRDLSILPHRLPGNDVVRPCRQLTYRQLHAVRLAVRVPIVLIFRLGEDA